MNKILTRSWNEETQKKSFWKKKRNKTFKGYLKALKGLHWFNWRSWRYSSKEFESIFSCLRHTKWLKKFFFYLVLNNQFGVKKLCKELPKFKDSKNLSFIFDCIALNGRKNLKALTSKLKELRNHCFNFIILWLL